jgi:four helix bundle protein
VKNEKLTDRSYRYTVEIVKFIFSIPKNRTLHSIIDQFLRASTSISANIFEAQGASSKKDFAKFYQIAFKSAVETKFWLNLLRDTTDIDKSEIDYFVEETKNLTNILAASLITLKRNEKLKAKK